MQEYERAVIFRLGRLMSGGARGPGEAVNRITMQIILAASTNIATLRLYCVTNVTGYGCDEDKNSSLVSHI